jgi:GntR family transcriptional repressor for pyruvate dehydrogenase complex
VYSPIRPARLYEKIAEQIKQRILSGELQNGDRLPSERELSDQFDVSRTAIREAIQALVQEGLVEVRHGRGAFVVDSTSDAVKQSLGLMIKIGQADSSAVVVEVRELLEPGIAALAATRATQDHLAALRGAVERMDASFDDIDAFIVADDEFHLTLAEATRNPLILTLIDPIVELLHEQRKRVALVSGGPEQGQYHHKQILKAVANGEPEEARDAMRAHLRQVRGGIEATSSAEVQSRVGETDE